MVCWDVDAEAALHIHTQTAPPCLGGPAAAWHTVSRLLARAGLGRHGSGGGGGDGGGTGGYH